MRRGQERQKSSRGGLLMDPSDSSVSSRFRPVRITAPSGTANTTSGAVTGAKACFSMRNSQKRKRRPFRSPLVMAADLGFEPRHTESESAVLPLHKSATNKQYYTHTVFDCQGVFQKNFLAFVLRVRRRKRCESFAANRQDKARDQTARRAPDPESAPGYTDCRTARSARGSSR